MRKLARSGSSKRNLEMEVVGFWRRCEGMGEENEGEDVTPTAVAKEVIGLRPCARYPNDEGDEKGTDVARGRRREGSSANEDNGDWRRLFDVAPLPRVPPIREGVSRPPPESLPVSYGKIARGGRNRPATATPPKFECRIALYSNAAGPFSPFRARKGERYLRRDFTPRFSEHTRGGGKFGSKLQ